MEMSDPKEKGDRVSKDGETVTRNTKTLARALSVSSCDQLHSSDSRQHDIVPVEATVARTAISSCPDEEQSSDILGAIHNSIDTGIYTATEVVGNRKTEVLGRQVWSMENQGSFEESRNVKSRKRDDAKCIEKTSHKTLAMVLEEKGYRMLTDEQVGSAHQTNQTAWDEQEKELREFQGVIHVSGLSLSKAAKKLKEFSPNVNGCYVTLKTT